MRTRSIDPAVAKSLQESRQLHVTHLHAAEQKVLEVTESLDALKSVVREAAESGKLDESVVKAAVWSLVDQRLLKVTLGGKVLKTGS